MLKSTQWRTYVREEEILTRKQNEGHANQIKKTLPKAQRTQGIESLNFIEFLQIIATNINSGLRDLCTPGPHQSSLNKRGDGVTEGWTG